MDCSWRESGPVYKRQNYFNMNIILNADDFGFDEDTLESTIYCFEQNALTSATIMPTMPLTYKALDYAGNNPQYSYGVHLTYIDALKPLSKASEIKSLVNSSGLFMPSNVVRIKSMFYLLNKTQIIEETKRQIGLLLDHNIPVSHVDSHGHIHKYPVFSEALRVVLRDLGITRVRKVQDVFVGPDDESAKRKFIHSINSRFAGFIQSNYTTTDYFYMPASRLDTAWTPRLMKLINRLGSDKTMEIGIHPGSVEVWRKNELNEAVRFCSFLKKTRHRLINWNDI